MVNFFTHRNTSGPQHAPSLCLARLLDTTLSPNGAKATRHGLPFWRLYGVSPSRALEMRLNMVPACSVHAMIGWLAGTSNPEKNSTCSRRVRTNPATCCTVASTSPLDSSWPSIGAAAGTTSIWTCLHGARWVALDPDLSTIRLHPISCRYPSRQFTP